MEAMEAMDLEPTEHTALEPTAMLTTQLPQLPPGTLASPPLPLSLSPASPEPLSLLSLEATLPLDVTSPTLLESSMSPRGRPRLRLTPTTLTDTTVSATPDTTDTPDMVASDTLASDTPASATTTASATDTTPTLLPPLPSLPPSPLRLLP